MGEVEAISRMGALSGHLRVVQAKPKAPLRVLHVVEVAGLAKHPARTELLAEADGRGLDGVFIQQSPSPPAGAVLLLRPQERVVLVDDDKREGVSQQLLSDMFTRMSLR